MAEMGQWSQGELVMPPAPAASPRLAAISQIFHATTNSSVPLYACSSISLSRHRSLKSLAPFVTILGAIRIIIVPFRGIIVGVVVIRIGVVIGIRVAIRIGAVGIAIAGCAAGGHEKQGGQEKEPDPYTALAPLRPGAREAGPNWGHKRTHHGFCLLDRGADT
jgi:hypothetical protein